MADVAPEGYTDPEQPGFRYDLATDTAVTLPLVVAPLTSIEFLSGRTGSLPVLRLL